MMDAINSNKGGIGITSKSGQTMRQEEVVNFDRAWVDPVSNFSRK